jgi:hypothetical protein
MRISTIPYGAAPVDLGHHQLDPSEMLVYLYLPVRMARCEGAANEGTRLPQRLAFVRGIVDAAIADAGRTLDVAEHYVYLTAKTLWVEPGFSGNRPGWHADGYGSGGDLNYIWHDMNPTQFAVQPFEAIPDDDFASMQAMEAQIDPARIVTYPDSHLLRLDESVVHRVNPDIQAGMRTFVKISVSRHRFNLRMNSHNHLFDYAWTMHDRAEVRNMDSSNKDHVALAA